MTTTQTLSLFSVYRKVQLPPQAVRLRAHSQPPHTLSYCLMHSIKHSSPWQWWWISGESEETVRLTISCDDTQDVTVTRRGSQQSQFSTPTEESCGRHSQKKPQLEGYVQPQQASPHTLAGQCLTVETLIGGGSVDQHHSGSPTPNSEDISKGIDRVIEETVSKVREEEEVVVGDDGEGIPYDPIRSAPSGYQRVFLVCLLCDAKLCNQSRRVTTPIEVTQSVCVGSFDHRTGTFRYATANCVV